MGIREWLGFKRAALSLKDKGGDEEKTEPVEASPVEEPRNSSPPESLPEELVNERADREKPQLQSEETDTINGQEAESEDTSGEKKADQDLAEIIVEKDLIAEKRNEKIPIEDGPDEEVLDFVNSVFSASEKTSPESSAEEVLEAGRDEEAEKSQEEPPVKEEVDETAENKEALKVEEKLETGQEKKEEKPAQAQKESEPSEEVREEKAGEVEKDNEGNDTGITEEGEEEEEEAREPAEAQSDSLTEKEPIVSTEQAKEDSMKTSEVTVMGENSVQSESTEEGAGLNAVATFLQPQRPEKQVRTNSIEGPMGLDIGTTNVVLAYKKGSELKVIRQLNAFYTLHFSRLTKQALLKDGVMFFEKDNMLYILGHAAGDFANICGSDTRRPIESGMLNPKEDESESVIRAIVNQLIKPARNKGEKICFSVPGEPMERPDSSLVYHESIIKLHLATLGYTPVAINEGMAIILSELSDSNFTGLGISLGGGMCNVCFSYLTVPVVSFSIQKGGDYIDNMVARSVGEPPAKIRQIKEKELDLSVSARNRIETGLNIYYDDLFASLIKSLQKVLGTSENIPRLAKPIPVVLGGGTVLPRGSREKFEKALKEIRLPIAISEVVMAENPLSATAKGALMMALLEN